MFKTPLLLSVVILFSIASCPGQDLHVQVLKGIVINADNGEPISYATLYVSLNGINTMTNERGRFVFKIPAGRQHDSVYITHVGYRPVAIIVHPADSAMQTIKMEVAPNQLSDIVVKTINPLDLLKKAISRIPENYPSAPYRLNGFYRLTGAKEKRIIHLSEAVFDLYSDNYTGKNKQFKLIKTRSDKDLTAFNGSDEISIGWKPQEIFSMDMVSDIKGSDLLSPQAMKEYKWVYKGLVNYNGVDAYEIAFDQRDGIKKSLYQGKMLLDADNLSFLEFDLRLSPKGLSYYEWGFLQKLAMKLAHVRLRMLGEAVVITYRKYGSKYYLNHVNTSSRYYIAGGSRHYLLDPLINKTNYLVTGIDTGGVQAFDRDEVLKNNKRIEDHNKVLNDSWEGPDRSDTADRFWESYNLIEPEFRVDSAVRVIQTNNETLNYKKILEGRLPKYGSNKVSRIDSILNFYHLKEQFNGTALIQYDGKLLYEKGFGMADKELQLPNTGQTRFRIGSTSKQFTSMLIMQLANENKLQLSDSVGKFLPAYVHGSVTIQQLLTHQSGIPNYTDVGDYYVKITEKKYSPDELVSQFCSDSLEFVPGTQFHYSNSGYVVLADIIEKVTGRKYADVLAERIFNPLDMKNTYFGPEASAHGGSETSNHFGPDPSNNHTGSRLAKGYINGLPEKLYPVDNVIGAGAITSTAEDLLRWTGALSANALLPKEKMEELFRPRVEWDEWGAWYGYGWMIDRYAFQASKKHTVQYHPGTEFGFYDMLVRQPDKGIVVLLLNNTGDFPRFDMTDLILQVLN